MSGDDGKRQLGKAPVFKLEGASGQDFESAFRRAEEGLQAPVPTFRRLPEDEDPPEAETMPQLPEREDPVFVNDGLPSLMAAEGGLFSEFIGSNLFGEEEAEKALAGDLSGLDDVIFSADPRANEEGMPRVTGRTEPEFLFKR